MSLNDLKKENDFTHWKEVDIRYRDLDPLNHVNNAIFNTYFEESRIHFLHSFPELGENLGTDYSFVLVKITIEYKAQVMYPSTLMIGSKILKLGNTSIQTFQSCFDAESKELKATANSILVWYDIHKQRPAKLPELKS
ncbi:MAG TPA: thioesterase family protein [Balneolales bacterium]|nr:thioesterase family protein [Balneolales bacterium]